MSLSAKYHFSSGYPLLGFVARRSARPGFLWRGKARIVSKPKVSAGVDMKVSAGSNLLRHIVTHVILWRAAVLRGRVLRGEARHREPKQSEGAASIRSSASVGLAPACLFLGET